MAKHFNEGNGSYGDDRYHDGPTIVSGLSSQAGSALIWSCFGAGALFGLALGWASYMVSSSFNRDATTFQAS